jgi:hypothetical protein
LLTDLNQAEGLCPARFFAFSGPATLENLNLAGKRKDNHMNPLIQLKRTAPVFLGAFLLACFGLLDGAQAVVPPPDGGYPGGNTAEGDNALLSLTEGGTFNTAVGLFSLSALTTGGFNTGVGAGALLVNTADNNTATGAAALFSNTIGSGNTANGTAALLNNTTGIDNAATGFQALSSNTIGDSNTATGFQALLHNTTGRNNTANGAFALLSNTIGIENTANGVQALFSNTTGFDNTATGFQALVNNTTGNGNTANGLGALVNNTTASGNTANGAFALLNNTTGVANTANGLEALLSNTTGNANTANGFRVLWNNTIGGDSTANGAFALFFNTTGSGNTANGVNALLNNTTGSGNVALGFEAGNNQTSGSNNVYIGSEMQGVAGESSACYIASIFGQTSANGIPVLINAVNKLGTTTSSKRFKEDINPMDKASEVLFELTPVTFRYKKGIDPAGTPQFGLVAEDVEKANPDLVVRDKEGKPYTVRYDAVNAMLLNEFLKEHRKVEKLEAALCAVNERLAEQDAKIEKVSAQIEVRKPAPQTVLNNR